MVRMGPQTSTSGTPGPRDRGGKGGGSLGVVRANPGPVCPFGAFTVVDDEHRVADEPRAHVRIWERVGVRILAQTRTLSNDIGMLCQVPSCHPRCQDRDPLVRLVI